MMRSYLKLQRFTPVTLGLVDVASVVFFPNKATIIFTAKYFMLQKWDKYSYVKNIGQKGFFYFSVM